MKSFLVLAAMAGVAHANPAAWCGGVTRDATFTIEANGAFKYNSERDDLADVDAFANVVLASCSNDRVAVKYRRELEAARQRWTKRLQMRESDWADALPFADQRDVGDRRKLRIDLPNKGFAVAELSPVYQYLALWNLDFEHAYSMMDDVAQWATQAERVGFVARCLEPETQDPVQFLMCAADAEQLDLAKLDDELRGNDGPASRMTVRLIAERTLRRFLERRVAFKAHVKQDSAYRQLVEAAKTELTRWSGKDPNITRLQLQQYKLATAMDSKKPIECEAALTKELNAYLASIPIADYQKAYEATPRSPIGPLIRLVQSTPEGYLTSSNYAECVQLHGENSPLSRAIATTYSDDMNGMHGAMMTAMRRANPQPAVGSFKFPKRPTDVDLPDDAAGVVKSATKLDATTHVVFAAKKNGSAPPPADVETIGIAVKPGMYVVQENGLVVIAFKKQGDMLPSIVLGRPVK
ncbi:MAG: hypothetical protein QM831_28820 [Kofleriaceae bacterium]